MNIKTIKFENPDWEEISTYYYIQKKIINNDLSLFIKEISEIIDYKIRLEDFNDEKLKISRDELNKFFKNSGIENIDILNEKSFEEDWNLIDTFLETKDYYIFRNWETTA